MFKLIFSKINDFMSLFSRRLKLFFYRRTIYLVEEKKMQEALFKVGYDRKDKLKTIKCAVCEKKLTLDTIYAWTVTEKDVVFYCEEHISG